MTEKKIYTIHLTRKDNKLTLERTNDGFTPFELLGLCEFLSREIVQQIAGDIKPDIIKRNVIGKEKK